MKRVYIAGPISGMPSLNFPAFHAAAAHLRGLGHHVENPVEINADPDAQWADCMRMDIPRLCTCDAIFLLEGWRKSKGAQLEATIADALGMEVIFAGEPAGLEAILS